MHRTAKLLLAFAVAAAAGCATDLGSTAPTEFNGIKYSAAVEDIISQNGARQFSVVATLTNTGTATQTRTYLVSCPVRIRLYRSGDNALLYDEDRRPCPSSTTGQIVIDAQSSRTLQSGVRFPSTVLGDSLSVGTYTVRVIIKTEGSSEVLINAGSITF